MPKIQGIDEITSTRQDLYTGNVPVGGIIGVHETRFSLASGVILSGGFMLCDGSAIPPGQTLSGTVPDITNTKFLRGNTVAGATTNNNNRALDNNHLPSHTHTSTSSAANLSHNHNAGISAANLGQHTHTLNLGADNAPHSHNQYYSTGSGGPGNYRSDLNHPANATGVFEQNDNVQAVNMPHDHSFNLNSQDAPHAHPGSVGTSNAPHDHTMTLGGAGSGQSFSITPVYASVMYLIRVV